MEICFANILTGGGGWYQFSGRGKSGEDRARHARDLSARFKIQKKQNKYGSTKIITYQVVFFLSVRDWIKTKVVLWASVVKQFSIR